MVTWGAVLGLVVSALTLGLSQESTAPWIGDAALLTLALSVFILICVFESGRPDRPQS